MQNKMMKTALLASVVAILSACGGGGDSKPNTQATNTTNNGSQVNKNQQSNSGSQTSKPTTNTGSQTTATNSLTFNENLHLFTAENKFKVKPPTAPQQAQIQIAIAETNKLRAEKGLPALKYDASLAAFAQRRAEEIVGRFSHTRPDSNQSYLVEVNAGENIAAGNATGKDTVIQWRNSKGHYENIIGKGYQTIGLGMVAVPGSQYGYYWVQIFGGSDTTSNYVFDNTQTSRLDNVTANTVSALTDKYQWLQVDGVPIHLGNPRSKGAWEHFESKGYSGQTNAYDDVRFGVMKQGSGSLKVLYTGRNTEYENMPQTGSANYTGKAVITDGKTLNTNLDAHFKADFGNKKLTGVLSEKGNRVVDINAHIRGSTFHSPQNAPVETQGSFFGKTANELGGVFHENATGKFGAFGAKR